MDSDVNAVVASSMRMFGIVSTITRDFKILLPAPVLHIWFVRSKLKFAFTVWDALNCSESKSFEKADALFFSFITDISERNIIMTTTTGY